MPNTNAISYGLRSQELFSMNLQNRLDSSLLYIKNTENSYEYCDQSFFSLLNLPIVKNFKSYDNYKKLELIHDLDESIIKNRAPKNFSFAYSISEHEKKLFIIDTVIKDFNKNQYLVSKWSLFSNLNSREDLLRILNLGEIENEDLNFPINEFSNVSPINLAYSEEEWMVIWFFILGKSIRWIGNYLNMTKKIIEMHIYSFYDRTGISNKKNLMAISYKYNWLSTINKKTIDIINAHQNQDKKNLF